jgi:hypothetical protein
VTDERRLRDHRRVSSPHEQREQDDDRANHEKCIDPITHIQQYQAIRAINACSVNEETSNGPRGDGIYLRACD